jgi:hypothetical protein
MEWVKGGRRIEHSLSLVPKHSNSHGHSTMHTCMHIYDDDDDHDHDYDDVDGDAGEASY